MRLRTEASGFNRRKEGEGKMGYVDGSVVNETGSDAYPLDDGEEAYLKKDAVENIAKSLQVLELREQLMLRMRFGLVSDEGVPALFQKLAQSILDNPNTNSEVRDLVRVVCAAKIEEFDPKQYLLKTPTERFLLSMAGKVPKDYTQEQELTLEEANQLLVIQTREEARLIYEKALRKLRQPSHAAQLRELLGSLSG